MAARGEGWDPGQYGQFEQERSRPFYDLVSLVERREAMRVLDLGCGTGKLTAWLHRALEAGETLGIDRAQSMLDRAPSPLPQGLRFERHTIEDVLAAERPGRWDLVFSNAALQWLPGHDRLVPAVARLVGPGGQLAIQVPANTDHLSHQIARSLATDHRFAGPLDGYEREDTVRSPEWYAEQLYALGFESQQVRLQIYGHVLPSTRSVSDWVQGSLLTPYRERLGPALYQMFLAIYEERVAAQLGESSPYFYPFKRLLIWARRPPAR